MLSRRISGRSAVSSTAVLLALVLTGCNYGFRGGGGFPPHIRTIHIAPFENRTDKPELDPEIFRALNDRLPRALGVRQAGERAADAIVRGEITRYEDLLQNYRPGSEGSLEVELNQVQVVVSLQIIDVRNNAVLWESSGISGRGEYRPGSQSDEVARVNAINSLIQQIIDGAQSQW
jgi:hypothetical protein